jgi:hypothetical protein
MLEMFAFKVGDRDVAKYERPVLAMLGSVRRHALGRAERRYRRFVEFAKPRVAIWGWPRSRRWGRLRSNIHRCGLAATFNLEASCVRLTNEGEHVTVRTLFPCNVPATHGQETRCGNALT